MLATLFVDVYERLTANDHVAARSTWSRLETLVPLLFREANPMPIRYCLWRPGLISSPECRLPLTSVSRKLAGELDQAMDALARASAARETVEQP